MPEACASCGAPRRPVSLPVSPGRSCATCYRPLTVEALSAGVATTPPFDLHDTVIQAGSTIEWLPAGSEDVWTPAIVVSDGGSRVRVHGGVEVPRDRILAVYVG
jgi:hypothetical protein